MNLRQLSQFVAVAEELHFGRAADRLGMTQPPLSQSIQALEEELGVALFARTRRSVALTAVGAEWLPHVRQVLEGAASLPETARRLARGQLGSLRLAFVSIAAYSILPELISSFKAAFPAVDVSLREATSDVQIEALLAGEIDAGLIIPQTGLQAGLAYRPLLREPLVAAVPQDWVESGRIDCADGRLVFGEVLGEPLILFPRQSAPAFHDIVTSFYALNRAEPAIVQEAIQMQTIIALVAVGLGLALVPRSLMALQRDGVRYLPLAGEAPEIETGLVWRRRDPLPTVAHLVEMAGE
ncbi:LysR family transcriptional regulator [Amorphus orientalis]|uniref:DNA-binding transcriptional LysR family regulator n=1 Tax=Amorphus orientalis TaxID=649198 RepID=A0AAE4ASP1_9HYPH|nr:LysR family transcriptional regulator [Amorphus orientalis]MDQ0314159.1 DNA-binding transcriptional LysR family regulator [Amorphus orientalis]